MKRIQWLGTSLNTVREFSEDARALIGQELRMVQSGLMPTYYKPMPAVGSGAYEIRVRAGNQHRVIYVAKFSGSVYVLHCFVKKTQKTAQADLDIAKSRYAAMLIEHKETKS